MIGQQIGAKKVIKTTKKRGLAHRLVNIPIHKQIGGGTVVIDVEDVDCLDRTWRVEKGSNKVVRTENRKTVLLHRRIMAKYQNIEGKQIDHINHDRTDNRKSNLRVCSNSQNSLNRRIPKNNTTGFIGVRRTPGAKTYQAQHAHNGHNYYLGSYDDPDVAAAVRDFFAIHVNGRYAYLNYREYV